MQLKDLQGKHELTGVDFGSCQDCYGDYVNCIWFVLGDETYMVSEDPEDGNRSAMKDIALVEKKVKNKFQPVSVTGVHIVNLIEDVYYKRDECDDVLQLVDDHTEKIVLEVGTDYSDSYYPNFVCSFHPENMSINNQVSTKIPSTTLSKRERVIDLD